MPDPTHTIAMPSSVEIQPAPAQTPESGIAPRQQTAQALCPLTVLILSYNEEVNLPHALRSVCGWARRVFVIDSGSTDTSRQIAAELGATVIEHPWEGYARQKNWALDSLPIDTEWVFILDADEVVTDALRQEIDRLVRTPSHQIVEDGFFVNRALMFMGGRIRHCGYNPSWNLRLFRRGRARYEDRPVHEHMLVDGEEGYLKGLLHHEDRRGLEYYIAKHNRYSTLEAQVLDAGDANHAAEIEPNLFGNAIQRRRFFKQRIYPYLPAKWLWRFLWMYFVRLGFLDGANGLRFCLLISTHELFTSLKLRELRLNRQVPPAGSAPASPPAGLTVSSPPVVLEQAVESSVPTDASRDATVRRIAGRSPYSRMENIRRVAWMTARATLFRCSFHNWYGWRNLVLRAFGMKVGRGCRIRPSAVIEMPWNIELGDWCVVGDHAILYALGKITVGRQTIISQYAHLCAGTHDHTTRLFPLLKLPITLGRDVWIAADAFVGPGVTIGDRSILGARSSAFTDLPEGMICVGNPAKPVKSRLLEDPST